MPNATAIGPYVVIIVLALLLLLTTLRATQARDAATLIKATAHSACLNARANRHQSNRQWNVVKNQMLFNSQVFATSDPALSKRYAVNAAMIVPFRDGPC